MNNNDRKINRYLLTSDGKLLTEWWTRGRLKYESGLQHHLVTICAETNSRYVEDDYSYPSWMHHNSKLPIYISSCFDI